MPFQWDAATSTERVIRSNLPGRGKNRKMKQRAAAPYLCASPA